MVVGTLLGDASMWMLSRYPRYRAAHGLPQKDYCAAKETLLREFIRTPMKVYPNGGHGAFTARFDTLTSPEFLFVRRLCYRPDATTGKLKKTVTPEWVDQLTWEAVAWWFMDDGCRQENALMISTHSFKKEEVELLADWLTLHGCPAYAHKTRKGPTKTYYLLKITTESAATFKENVDPFILPMMRYKLETAGPRGETLSCTFCGKEFAGNGRQNGGQGKTPCCRRPTCKKKAVALRSKTYEERMGGSKVRYQRERAARSKRPPEELERLRLLFNERQNARQAEMSPAEKARYLQRKRERRAAAKLLKTGK